MIQRTMKPKQLSLVDLCAAFVERRYLFDNYSDFTRDLGNNKPCIFTYGAKFGAKSGGHAVLAVGYVETTKYQYLQIADGWNDYLRYINFNGYDYTRKDGWSFSVSK